MVDSIVGSVESVTQTVSSANPIPRHIAIVMDGNGRWAKQRFLPRIAGHRKGVGAVREAVRSCLSLGVPYLTLFAFSSENCRRPTEEVGSLMQLFLRALEVESQALQRHAVRLKVIGDRNYFNSALIKAIEKAEALTAPNSKLILTIAANYGGRWDILNAVKQWIEEGGSPERPLSEWAFARHLMLSYAPEPDLFIRTGGEKRISNFLLWQLAYSELYFTDTLWPDFDRNRFQQAIESYQRRERRFGQVSGQLLPAVAS